MATEVLLQPTSAGATVVAPDAMNYERVTFSAGNLATIEAVIVNILLPDGKAVLAEDCILGTVTGLVAGAPSKTYFGGATYQLVASTTAGLSGVYMTLVGKSS
jgi:hypothetical protein